MGAVHRISSAVRGVGAWLALVILLAGPLGPEASAAVTAPEACETLCPCDAAPDVDQAGDQGCSEDPAGGDCDDSPCDEGCPDGCPQCGCCTGALAGLLPRVAPAVPRDTAGAESHGSPDAPAAGAIFDIFEPPRPT